MKKYELYLLELYHLKSLNNPINIPFSNHLSVSHAILTCANFKALLINDKRQ